MPKQKQDLTPLIKFAQQTYQDVAIDLMQAVPEGQGFYYAAHDHIGDRLCDQFHATHPNVDFGKVAKEALKGWVHDDRKEARAYEAKLKRAAQRKPRARKAKTPKLTWWQELGYTVKPRKGIGSL